MKATLLFSWLMCFISKTTQSKFGVAIEGIHRYLTFDHAPCSTIASSEMAVIRPVGNELHLFYFI